MHIDVLAHAFEKSICDEAVLYKCYFQIKDGLSIHARGRTRGSRSTCRR